MKRRMKRFLPLLLTLLLCLAGCGGRKEEAEKPDGEFSGSMPLRYAEQFTVDYYADGCALITVGGEDRFLLVPEGQEPPQETDPGVKVLRQPVSSIYAASSSVMDLFLRADALDAVSMTSTSAENWTIPEIRELVREDEITYVGKYSAPDYEAVLDIGCDLAVAILDVRTAAEYNEGHIPGAINIPNEAIGTDAIPELPDKDQLILVYCRSGNRSKQASEKLVKLGYTNVVEFGGIIDWPGETETNEGGAL